MFSTKQLIYIMISLLFSVALGAFQHVPTQYIKPLLLIWLVGSVVLFLLYSQWYFDEEKIVETIVQKREKKEMTWLQMTDSPLPAEPVKDGTETNNEG